MNLAEGINRDKQLIGGTQDRKDINKYLKIESIIRDILSETR
jgi:hypothetical protein